MHAQLVDTQQRISKMRKVIERDHKELHNVQVQIDESKKRGLDMKRSLATRQQTFAMLPQAKENIAKLEVRLGVVEWRLQYRGWPSLIDLRI